MSVTLFMLEDAAKALLLQIRQKATEVYNILQQGYPENVYQKALCVEFQMNNIHHDLEVTMSIPYKAHVVGQIRADIILRGTIPVIIETKATAYTIKQEERWQLSRYMKIQNISLGVLINFRQSAGKQGLQVEFIIKDEDEAIYLYDLDTNQGTPLE
jgi:GxxExxY protein